MPRPTPRKNPAKHTEREHLYWRTRWEQMKADAAAQAHGEYMRDPSLTKRYLYFTAAKDGAWGQLHIVKEGDTPPAGSELANTEHIPMGTVQEVRHWLFPKADYLPMIGDDE